MLVVGLIKKDSNIILICPKPDYHFFWLCITKLEKKNVFLTVERGKILPFGISLTQTQPKPETNFKTRPDLNPKKISKPKPDISLSQIPSDTAADLVNLANKIRCPSVLLTHRIFLPLNFFSNCFIGQNLNFYFIIFFFGKPSHEKFDFFIGHQVHVANHDE